MMTAAAHTASTNRRITHRTKGHGHGPITRLASPGDLGQLVKPFVFLDYFDFSNYANIGGPVHPHSGIATHTTLLQGSMEYADSTGASGRLDGNSVEWMQAGGGVWHGGGPVGDSPLRGFQLWIALPPPLELATAESHYIGGTVIPTDGHVRLLLGSYEGLVSPIPYKEPVTYLHVRIAAGERWTYQPPRGHDIAWLAVATGSLRVGETSLRREMAVFEDGNAPITMTAEGDVELVIGSASRHPFPLVTGSYSVHTSHAALTRGEAGYATVAQTMKLQPGKLINT